MEQKLYIALRTIAFVIVALHVAACGFMPSTVSKAPSGSTPLSAGGNLASGPILGAWWDANHSGLRMVYGVAGAAYQGSPTYSDGTYSGAAACARKNIALLTTPSGSLFSVSLPQGKPVAVASNGPSKASIVFSPSCTWALVYTTGVSKALLVQELLSTPAVTPVALPSGASAIAVADSGSVLIGVPATDGSVAIQLLANGSSTPHLITVLSKYGGMAFAPGADTALLADAAMNTVVEASQLTGNMSLAPVAGAPDGVSKPTAVAISSDGRWAAVANNSGSSVLRLDLTGQSAPVKTVCHCSPTELEPLAGNFAFRLNEAGSGTVWAFDGNGSQPRVFFIPTDQATSTGHGGSL